MQRKDVELALLQKLEEIVEMYHQYNPGGDYLQLSYVDGNFHVNNAYYDADSAKPIDTFRNEKCWIVDKTILWVEAEEE